MASHAYTPAPDGAHHHHTRRALEARIEELIGLLDEVDGDQDGEDDDPAEWTAPERAGSGFAHSSPDDAEDGTDAEPDEDGEPTLGYPEGLQQPIGSGEDGEVEASLGWSANAGQLRLHAERCDAEAEPSLSASNVDPDDPATVSQVGWGEGGAEDAYITPDRFRGDAEAAARIVKRDLDRMVGLTAGIDSNVSELVALGPSGDGWFRFAVMP